jgi:hypothetical protein
MIRQTALPALLLATFTAGIAVGRTSRPAAPPAPAAESRLFELRTYTSPAGKLPNLHTRFRDHTMKLFERHGMTNVGYWTPQDSARSGNTLVYLLAYPSREARAASWAAFNRDPEWQQVRTASEANGRIVEKVESVFLVPTDFSPMK